MKQPIKYFSMFSGIGGFEYGMEQSDYEFECVGYSEIDKYARSIYEKHYPNHINYGDATRIRTSELPDFDLLVGGFPCQAFSSAGKRKGFEDSRGTLFFEIARVLQDKTPTYFLLENVKGLLSHDRGRTIQTIFRVCDELRYDVSWEIYNSKDYGVPQSRERVFIKGYFRGKCGQQILCKSRESIKVNEVDLNRLNKHKKLVQDGKIYGYDGLSITLDTSCGGLYYVPKELKLKQLNNHKKTTQSNRVYDSECLSITLNAAGNNGLYKISNNIRRLTPVECERLQGFPDNWTKYGKDNEPISDTQRYKCCGNAVTTNVITAIINEMFKEVIEDEND